ncbi:MAG: hypothetical protein ACWGQW_01290 [bacterium]
MEEVKRKIDIRLEIPYWPHQAEALGSAEAAILYSYLGEQQQLDYDCDGQPIFYKDSDLVRATGLSKEALDRARKVLKDRELMAMVIHKGGYRYIVSGYTPSSMED